MVGSIDPRCEQIRGTHWPNKVAWLIGTRVAEAILASGLTSRTKSRTYGCKRSDQTSKSPCATGAVHIWVPAFAGTTELYANVTATHAPIPRASGRSA